MKIAMALGLLALAGSLAGGCAAPKAPLVPPTGALVTLYTAPLTSEFKQVPVDAKARKVSASTYYLHDYILTGVQLAWDEAAIQQAAKGGGLTTVHYADYEWKCFLGFFGIFTVNIYGI